MAPSLPGWAFSTYPNEAGFKLAHHAELANKLMLRLGYDKYVVQGGDWGSSVGRVLSILYPHRVVALHLNNFEMPEVVTTTDDRNYSSFELRQLENYRQFLANGTAYVAIQSTKPFTLGVALHDSPVGLLAWIADKLFLWADTYPRKSDGYRWTYTEIITWTLVHYLADGGPITELAMYAENDGSEGDPLAIEGKSYVPVPTGVSAFAAEPEMVPKTWAQTKANVVWWREHELGGHFAMYERPEEMVKDISDFVAETLGSRVL